mmetsp:Transcript_70935/g.122967  ORF Transcript_70935/g.122967 Transcript_70935/m.122967 type:complete len:352 (-) Transcript_70935:59-1114(-)
MDVLGVVTTLAVAPPTAMHISIGGAVASVGINVIMMISFSLLTWWTMGDGDFDESDLDMPQHAPGRADAVNFPLPDYLREAGYEQTINIGVFGTAGSGKSSLVNALRRRKPGEADAAPVGVEETTTIPLSYSLVEADAKLAEKVLENLGTDVEKKRNTRPVRVWDLPGAGTTTFPSSCCVREMGLRYYDVIVLVVSGRVSETDIKVAHELELFKVPHFVARSQVDVDMENELEDHGGSCEEVARRLRRDMASQGFSQVFLVSSRQPVSHDFHQLSSSIIASVQAKRRVHKDENCPICFELFDTGFRKACHCHWCSNVVCNGCAIQLQGKLDETPCPFCRRWTALLPLDREC